MRRFAAITVALTLAGCATQPDVRNPTSGLVAATVTEPSDFEKAAPKRKKRTEAQLQKSRTAAFWAGIALTALGGASSIAFAATGQATQNQLDDGYNDSTLTRDEEDKLQTRGELMNRLSISGAALAVIGITIAAFAFGIDYTKCGKLAKRRRCPGRDEKRK